MTELTFPLRAPPTASFRLGGTVVVEAAGAGEAARAELDAHRLDLEMAYVARRPDVIRSLVRHGLNFVEAEDVIQEVFLRAMERPAIRPPGDSFRWLVTCAKNLAVDRYRRCRKEVLALAASWERWEKEVPDPRAKTEESLLDEERQRRLREAVAELTEPERRCLELRSQGIRFREIATQLGISPRKAAYLTDVAVDKLRRKLRSFKDRGE